MVKPGFEIGDKVLITTNEWFYGPTGQCYRAVHGTVNAILGSEQALGVKTNAKSTNWYVSIGNMLIAGCQIHYAVKTDHVTFSSVPDYSVDQGAVTEFRKPSPIYNADGGENE